MRYDVVLSGIIALTVCVACSSQHKAEDLKGENLLLAAGRDDTVNVEKLLKLGAAVNHRDRVTKITPLIEAVRFGRTSTALILLRAGANPNLQDRMGFTALTYAVLGGDKNTNLVQILLNAGADPMIRDNQGFTALDAARASPPRPAILKLLEDVTPRKRK